jgi:hypothetical protein
MNHDSRPAPDGLEPDGLDEVIEAFRGMSVPERPCDADVLQCLDVYRSDRARPACNRSLSKRRQLMRLLVSSTAAAVLLVGGLAFLSLNSTVSLAVADVVKSAEKHKLVRYRQRQTVFQENNVIGQIDRTIYADLTTPRLRSESLVAQSDSGPVLISVQDRVRHLATNSREKTARLGLTPKGFKSFCCSLEEFEQKKGVSRVNDTLGGLATVKYRFEEYNQVSSLWVDAKTKLPVRMEEELANSARNLVRTRFVWTDFEWDPELPKGVSNLDEFFSTSPPEAYTLDDQTMIRDQTAGGYP